MAMPGCSLCTREELARPFHSTGLCPLSSLKWGGGVKGRDSFYPPINPLLGVWKLHLSLKPETLISAPGKEWATSKAGPGSASLTPNPSWSRLLASLPADFQRIPSIHTIPHKQIPETKQAGIGPTHSIPDQGLHTWSIRC